DRGQGVGPAGPRAAVRHRRGTGPLWSSAPGRCLRARSGRECDGCSRARRPRSSARQQEKRAVRMVQGRILAELLSLILKTYPQEFTLRQSAPDVRLETLEIPGRGSPRAERARPLALATVQGPGERP